MNDQHKESADETNKIDSNTNTNKSFSRLNPKRVALALLMIVAVIGLAYAAVLIQQKSVQQNDKKQATQYESPNKLVSSIAPYLKGKSPNISAVNSLGGSTASGTLLYVLPPSKPAGVQFYVLPLQSAGAGAVADSIVSTENYKQLVKFFTDNHFGLVKNENGNSQPLSLSRDMVVVSYAVYESPNYLCSVSHVDASGTELANHLVGLGCADKASYASAAKNLAAFYNTYKGSNSNVTANIVLGMLTQKEQTNGDSYAILYQEDAKNAASTDGTQYFNGYYYKASSDQSWKLLKSTNVAIDCSEFNSGVLKKAFSGVDCYSSTSQALGKV